MIRGIFITIILGIIISFAIKTRLEDTSDSAFFPIVSGILLPFGIMAKIIVDLFYYPFETIMIDLMYFFINLSLIMSFYYLVLIFLLKWLRNTFNPTIVALLWTIPNFLYYFIINSTNSLMGNQYILTMKLGTIKILLILWICIFVFILGYKIYEHLSYKKELLKDSKEITDQNILNIFELEKGNKQIHSKLKIMSSNSISSPLTIGIRKPILLLPNKNYTDEEYHLIFSHEIIHIIRQDSITKLFLVFCNALCWFNPFMLIAIKKCSEDLELSCDYHVLRNREPHERKTYAQLILNDVYSEKGFTTCLSANAKSLHYRLKNIIQPKNTKLGSILICISFVLLILSWGNVGLAIDGYHGKEVLFQSNEFESIEFINVYGFDDQFYDVIEDKNEKVIYNYLSNLELNKCTHRYNTENLDSLDFLYNINGNIRYISLYKNNIITVSTFFGMSYPKEYYYVSEGIDFDLIMKDFEEYPTLKVDLLNYNISFNNIINAPLVQMIKNDEIIYEKEFNVAQNNYFGYSPTQAKLIFSEEITDYEILYDFKTISSKELNNHILELSGSHVIITVTATYTRNQDTYQATYKFIIE